MKVNAASEYIDKMKPNIYDNECKMNWISELDTQIAQDILNQAAGAEIETPISYNSILDAEKELLAPVPYTDMYLYYVAAKIDFNNRETAAYSNDMIMFNELWNEFAAFYRRTHMPKYSGNIKGV